MDVVVKEGTTVADPTRTVKYVAFENAAGKYMQYGATTGELVAFGTDKDTTIDATNILAGLAAEVGLSADTTNLRVMVKQAEVLTPLRMEALFQ